MSETVAKDFKVKHGLVVAEGGTFGGTVSVATPTELFHAATKAYVDANAGGSAIQVSETEPLSPNNGDAWLNPTTNKFYIFFDLVWIEVPGSGSGSGGFFLSETPPLNPEAGDTWFNTSTAGLYVFYNGAWVEIVGVKGDQGDPGKFIISDTEPANPASGDVWFDAVSTKFFIYYDSFWIEFGTSQNGVDGVASAVAPLQYNSETHEISIDLSDYYTTVQTDAVVAYAIAGLVDSAPSTLDTLNELAAALGDDANFAATIASELASKQPGDNDLTAISTLAGDSGFLKKTGTEQWNLDTNTYLTTTDASATYLPQADAAISYATIADPVFTGIMNVSGPIVSLYSSNWSNSIAGTPAITLQGVAPNILFADADATANGIIGVNGGNFYILGDTDKNGSYDSIPLNLDLTTGNATFLGTVDTTYLNTSGLSSTGLIRIGAYALSLTNGTGSIQIGSDTQTNLAIDNNDIQARLSGAGTDLFLNRLGGDVFIGNSTRGIGIENGQVWATGVYGNALTTSYRSMYVSSTDLYDKLGYVASSRDEKKNIEPLSYTAEQILSVEPVQYHYNAESDNAPKHPGMIAEDLHDAGLNGYVSYDKDGKPASINYEFYVSALQQVVRHQATQIEDLAQRLSILEGK